MQVTCASCGHIAELDDAKVPEGVFKVRCSKCGKIITAERKPVSDQIPQAIHDFLKQEVAELKQQLAKSEARAAGESSANPVAASNAMPPAGIIKRALVCEADPATAERIAGFLKQAGYTNVEFSHTTAETIKRIDNQPFSLVTVALNFPDDKDGGKKIIAKINSKKPSERRKMFVALISPAIKTGDVNAGFFEGTNITVSTADVPNLPALIAEGLQTFHEIYRVFDSVTTEREQNLQ